MAKKPTEGDDKSQANIGYENTEVRTDRDDMENTKAQPSKPSGKKSPVEDKGDSAGLRSESGKKSVAKKKGNLDDGK